MKQFFILTGAIIGITQLGSAATTCNSGSLASFIALGSTGCSIGSSTLTSFQTLPGGILGATAINPANITLTITPGIVGFSAQANATVGPNQIAEALFNYQVSGPSFNMSTITLSNTTETGDGGVTYLQNLCLGGQFSPSGVTGCGGPTRGLAVVNSGSDTANFSSISPIGVTDDFTVDGGLAGTAAGGTFTDQFTVPEPSTILLTGLGLAVAAFGKRRLAGILFSNQNRRVG